MQGNNKQRTSIPAWLDQKDYPFKGKFFDSPAGKMHYLDEGKGEPVVMVHGNPGWSYEFRNVIKALSGKMRCIAPDHIGFGFSDKPWEWDYLPAHHAENFEALMDHLDLKGITMIVNDWGGPIGLSYAIKHPERIKRLIILNTWLWSVKGDRHFERFSGMMGGGFGKFMILNFNFFGKAVVKKAFGDKSKLTKNIHRHYYKHLTTRQDRKGSWIFPGQIIGSSDWLECLWKQREKINQIPTTFIWGMKDIAFRERELQHWLDNWGESKVIRLPDAGHFPQEEHPEVVIREFQ